MSWLQVQHAQPSQLDAGLGWTSFPASASLGCALCTQVTLPGKVDLAGHAAQCELLGALDAMCHSFANWSNAIVPCAAGTSKHGK